jgi:hypothetical protein
MWLQAHACPASRPSGKIKGLLSRGRKVYLLSPRLPLFHHPMVVEGDHLQACALRTTCILRAFSTESATSCWSRPKRSRSSRRRPSGHAGRRGSWRATMPVCWPGAAMRIRRQKITARRRFCFRGRNSGAGIGWLLRASRRRGHCKKFRQRHISRVRCDAGRRPQSGKAHPAERLP